MVEDLDKQRFEMFVNQLDKKLMSEELTQEEYDIAYQNLRKKIFPKESNLTQADGTYNPTMARTFRPADDEMAKLNSVCPGCGVKQDSTSNSLHKEDCSWAKEKYASAKQAGWPPLEYNPKNQKDVKRLQDEAKKYPCDVCQDRHDLKDLKDGQCSKCLDALKEEDKQAAGDNLIDECNNCGKELSFGEEKFCASCREELRDELEGTEVFKSDKIAILNKSIANLTLTEPQLKIVAGIRETIDDYTDSFLSSVGSFFTYEWDPGASWEVKEVKGKKMIVRKEPAKKSAQSTRHAYRTGQVLKMFDGVMPVDVKVTALLGEDRYKVKSMIDSKNELEVDELDLFTIDTDPQIFN